MHDSNAPNAADALAQSVAELHRSLGPLNPAHAAFLAISSDLQIAGFLKGGFFGAGVLPGGEGDRGGVLGGGLIPGGFFGSFTFTIHVPHTPAHAVVSSGAASGVASTHLKKQLQNPSPGVSQWSLEHRIEQDAATAPRQAMHPRQDHGVWPSASVHPSGSEWQ